LLLLLRRRRFAAPPSLPPLRAAYRSGAVSGRCASSVLDSDVCTAQLSCAWRHWNETKGACSRAESALKGSFFPLRRHRLFSLPTPMPPFPVPLLSSFPPLSHALPLPLPLRIQPLRPHQATHPTSPCRESPSPPREWSPTPTGCSRRRARSGTRRPTLRAFFTEPLFFGPTLPFLSSLFPREWRRDADPCPCAKWRRRDDDHDAKNERDSVSFFPLFLSSSSPSIVFFFLLSHPRPSLDLPLKKKNSNQHIATTRTPTSSSPRATSPSAPSPTSSSRADASSTPRPCASPSSSSCSR